MQCRTLEAAGLAPGQVLAGLRSREQLRRIPSCLSPTSQEVRGCSLRNASGEGRAGLSK